MCWCLRLGCFAQDADYNAKEIVSWYNKDDTDLKKCLAYLIKVHGPDSFTSDGHAGRG